MSWEVIEPLVEDDRRVYTLTHEDMTDVQWEVTVWLKRVLVKQGNRVVLDWDAGDITISRWRRRTDWSSVCLEFDHLATSFELATLSELIDLES